MTYKVNLSEEQFIAFVNGDSVEVESVVENLIDQVEEQIKKNTAPRAHKFAVGDIVLHADGQYELEILRLIHNDKRNWAPEYEVRQRGYLPFYEFEHYLLGRNDE